MGTPPVDALAAARHALHAEAWEVIEALDTGDRYSDRIATLVFHRSLSAPTGGQSAKLEQMSPQRYDDWRNAVLRKIELSALVERTDLTIWSKGRTR